MIWFVVAGALWGFWCLAMWADEVADQAAAAAELGGLLPGWEVMPPCLV